VAQFLALLLVLGSYFAAQWLKVWRPRRRGQAGARIADRPPAAPVGAEPQTQAG
jgi:high-affinity iron transporter